MLFGKSVNVWKNGKHVYSLNETKKPELKISSGIYALNLKAINMEYFLQKS